MSDSPKKIKKKGPFRSGAIISIIVFLALVVSYFYFFFDNHLKNIAEWTGTQVYGAEINISNLKLDFIDAKFQVQGIQVTNKSNPKENLIEIDNIEFQALWDALLRAKVVVETTRVQGVALYTTRKRPGRIIPKSERDKGPAKALNEIEDKALEQAKSQYNENIIGDAASLVAGTDPSDQLELIKSELQSEKKLKELQNFVDKKKQAWEKRLKTLPNKEDIEALQTKIKSLKLDTGNLKEFAASVKEAEKVIKEADEKIKTIDKAQKDLKSDLKTVNNSTKSIEDYVDSDIKDLQKRLNIPSIDMGDFSKTLFLGMIAEKTASYKKYYELVKDYLPPKKSAENAEPKSELIPKKRGAGKDITYPITTGYPNLWIKEIKLSSKATDKGFSGDVDGTITNVTTQPVVLKKPVNINLKADFKKQNIFGITLKGIVDHTTEIPKQNFQLFVKSFPVNGQKLVSSKDLDLSIKDAVAQLQAQLKSQSEQVLMQSKILFNKVDYMVESPSNELKTFTESVVNDIPQINVLTSMAGTWSKARWKVESNLGRAFSNSFKKQLQNKIDQVKADLKNQVESKISAEKEKLNQQIQNFTKQYESKIDEVNKKANMAKKEAEKSLENKKEAKKKEGIKKLEEEGKKLLKDLKIGF